MLLYGTIQVYTFSPDTGEKMLFQKLVGGSSFNFVDWLLDYYSLFQFETVTRCILLEIHKDELWDIAKTDENLKSVLDELSSKMTISGLKYDFAYN